MSTDSRPPCVDIARGLQLAGWDAALYLDFVRQFPADDTFARLTHALCARDAGRSLRLAHTLKGLCAQLGLAALEDAAAALCRALRSQPPDSPAVAEAFRAVSAAHARTLAAIAAL